MFSLVQRHYRWLLPLVLFALMTPWSGELDMAVERLFYTPSAIPDERFIGHPIFSYLYTFGPFPIQIAAGFAVLACFMSYRDPRWLFLRVHALFFALTLFVGAVLITHVVFKDQWGRPRPKQVIDFGGKQTFRPYYSPNIWNQPEPSKSFPSGHCTTGFGFFALAVIGEETKRPWLTYSAYSVALLLGIALGLARMAQGGHFFTDVIASALIMWETTLFMRSWIYFDNKMEFSK